MLANGEQLEVVPRVTPRLRDMSRQAVTIYTSLTSQLNHGSQLQLLALSDPALTG